MNTQGAFKNAHADVEPGAFVFSTMRTSIAPQSAIPTHAETRHEPALPPGK
ncbi:hypothetical protein LLG95_10415 [bacterium]|nr:hypothetical protein [bacterium]